MQTIKIFLASSAELHKEREQFEVFIRRKNDYWATKGIYLKVIMWENFLDALSQTRLQDEYNKAIKECDLFVMLFFTKVGQYTEEEFETAFGEFKKSNKPFIFTYFKDASITTGSINRDMLSLLNFQDKLKKLGHFYTRYTSTEELLLKFGNRLEKLIETGFIELDKKDMELAANQTQINISHSKNVNTGDIKAGGNINFGDNNITKS